LSALEKNNVPELTNEINFVKSMNLQIIVELSGT